jgi:hypothetical protein
VRCEQLKFENLKFLLPSGHSFGTASEHKGLKPHYDTKFCGLSPLCSQAEAVPKLCPLIH